MNWSAVFRFSVNQEAFLDSKNIDELRNSLAGTSGADGDIGDLSGALALIRSWHDEQAARYAGLLGNAQTDGDSAVLVRSLLLGSAPMASSLGAVLQGLSAPGVFEDPVHLQLLALLADDVGVGQAEASRSDEFRLLMKRFGLNSYAVGAYDLSFVSAIDDRLFALPGVILAMSRRSDHYGPELCGMDFVLRAAGMLPCWTALQRLYPDKIDWRRLDLGAAHDHAVVDDPLACSRSVVERCIALGDPLSRRILDGIRWAYGVLRQWSDALFGYVTTSFDPHHSMTALVQRRARDASVYHHNYRLGGCPLSQRFKEAVDDPAPLVAALAQSPVVSPGASTKSVLVNGLVGPRGKMFRVFNDEELAVIRRWIDSLPGSEERHAEGRSGSGEVRDGRNSQNGDTSLPAQVNMELGTQPRNIREAYFFLQGRALPPRLRRYAIEYVQSWMRSAKRTSGTKPDSLPVSWPHDGLRAWLDDQHDKAGQGFQETAGTALPAREAVIDSTLQLAPLLCIDGAWLQGFTDTAFASSPATYALFQIYWDELGNGQYELNHPKIYRDLLRQMGVELPPTGAREFSSDERLRDEAFRLPVLWLCLGKLPSTFLPEILGMNLAMELSGVGGGYRSAHRFLAHHGFSTHFVDLHNTIDNVATGHSGKAAEAVDKYMRMQAQRSDTEALDVQWDRILTGYKSLTSVPNKTAGWLLNFRLSRQAEAGQAAAKDDGSGFYHHDWLKTEKDRATLSAA